MPATPSRNPELIHLSVRGLTFAVWDWPGDDPPLLFAHATSFHGRCWDQVIREFPEQRCLAIEARGHGRSSKPAPPHHWNSFVDDLMEIAERLGITGAIGIGHSMGGHTVTAVAAARPSTFAGLLLADPTIRAPELYGTPPLSVAFIRKRRVQWDSPAQMGEVYRNRLPFQRWKPEVLRDYCEFGLLPEGTSFVLACPPDTEASIYECSKDPMANLHGVIPLVKQPVTVLRAGHSSTNQFSNSPTDPNLASRFPCGRDVLLPQCSHFIPMEAPELIAAHIRELLPRVRG